MTLSRALAYPLLGWYYLKKFNYIDYGYSYTALQRWELNRQFDRTMLALRFYYMHGQQQITFHSQKLCMLHKYPFAFTTKHVGYSAHFQQANANFAAVFVWII